MRLRYLASNSTSKILTKPSPFQQDLVAVSLDLLLHILAKGSWSRILTEPSPFQQDLVAVSLDLQLPNLSLKPEMVKMILMLMMLEVDHVADCASFTAVLEHSQVLAVVLELLQWK